MDHVPDSRGMSDDAPEEAEAASPTTEAGVSAAGPDEGSDPEAPAEADADAVQEAATDPDPEAEPVLEAPTGDVEAESIAPPDELSAPEPEMEGPGEDGAEAVDLMGRA